MNYPYYAIIDVERLGEMVGPFATQEEAMRCIMDTQERALAMSGEHPTHPQCAVVQIVRCVQPSIKKTLSVELHDAEMPTVGHE